MSDAALSWSSDLYPNATGDVGVSSGSSLTQERLLRRLLTNPGDYLWHSDFGAGLGEFVGMPCDVLSIKARIRSQVFLENAIARIPEPVIGIQSAMDGGVYVQIQFVDLPTGLHQTLSFVMSS